MESKIIIPNVTFSLFILLILISCGLKKREEKDVPQRSQVENIGNSKLRENERNFTVQEDNQLNEIETITFFFDMLLDGYHKNNFCCWPRVLQDSLDKFYLDTSFFDLLREYNLGFGELSKFRNDIESCNKILDTLEEIQSDPSYNFEECKSFGSYRWLGGQGEDIDSFKVKPSSRENFKFQVIIYIGKYEFHSLQVTIIKDSNGKHLIESIEPWPSDLK